MKTMEGLHSIGERCYFQQFKGIIRYVGEVPPTEGTWYGVEWDAPRGKHDGMIHGQRYFQCKDLYGSFVRPTKVYFGVDAVTGLKKVYGDDSFTAEDSEKIINHKTKEVKVYELVGFDKTFHVQSNFKNLRLVDLYGAKISHALNGLESAAPNLTSLSLRDNLLSSLKDIHHIAGCLTKLNTLDISENRITDWNAEDLDVTAVFQRLQVLHIGKMKLKWSQLLLLLKFFRTVTEVSAYGNEIDDVRFDEALERIEVLDLTDNQINDWNSILQLSKLNRLQKLILSENEISKIEFVSDESETPFKNLTSFSLSNNQINEWHSVNSLNELKSLTEIVFTKNPILQGYNQVESREEVIARLGHVLVFNRSPVDETERRTAELTYMKKYSPSYYKATSDGSLEQFNKLHPRFLKIASVEGLPEEVKAAKSLKENLISLEIRCPDCSSKPVTQKKVPPTMTIQQLKGILQRIYKIPNSKQQVSYLDSQISLEIKLEDNMKQLQFYSISSGDTILLRW